MIPTMNQAARLLAYLAGPVRYGSAVAYAVLVFVLSLLIVPATEAAIIACLVLLPLLLMVKRTDKA